RWRVALHELSNAIEWNSVAVGVNERLCKGRIVQTCKDDTAIARNDVRDCNEMYVFSKKRRCIREDSISQFDGVLLIIPSNRYHVKRRALQSTDDLSEVFVVQTYSTRPSTPSERNGYCKFDRNSVHDGPSFPCTQDRITA